MRQRDRVKGPVLIPFALVLALMVAALLAISYGYEAQAQRQDLAASKRAVEHMLTMEIDSHAAKLHAALFPLSGDEALRNAFEARQRDDLLERVQPLFEEMRERFDVTHFYLVDPERSVVLRVHEPDFHGDVITRPTMLRAEKTGLSTDSIELGPLGTLTIRAVWPWHADGRLIGFLELGEELHHIASHIHAAVDHDIMVVIEREFLNQEVPTMRSDRREAGSMILSTTNPDIPESLAQKLASTESGLVHSDHGQAFYAASIPFHDASERIIGRLVLVRDVTPLQARLRRSLATVALFSLLAGGMVFALLYAILGRIERDYRRQRELETEFIRLSTSHQRIVQMEKLSEVGRTISEIAHQINNPLVGVINMSQLAEREAEDPVRVRQLLRDIRQAGSDCHAFVQRMLAFTRLSRSIRQPTEVAALVRDTIALFEQTNQTHPEIVARLPDRPVTLDIDAVLIRHALFNLLSNAAEVSPPGARIVVRMEEQANPEGAAGWCLSVKDQGPGLAPETRHRIFEPFFTTRPNGTGLGLAVVHHVAMIHDGEIHAENNPGGGANLALWLPGTPGNAGETT
ncbi:MAG TPA: ATP-binding protein [Thioalkalivibrio sp.]|nr:ATP-binding protein [Thioalkalivibrio sp.]